MAYLLNPMSYLTDLYFTDGQDNSLEDKNDWADMKIAGPDGAVEKLVPISFPGNVIEAGKVCKDDVYDYYEFTLDSAAKLSFNVSSSDAVKFTIYSLVKNAQKNTYSLKSLQSTSLKSGNINTKDLLLEKGTYYLCVQNNNKKSSNTDYSVSLNNNSVFFTKGDNGDDNWLYDKKTKEVNPGVGMTIVDKENVTNGWVGFGDAVDYYEFDLMSAANLSFDVTATDAAKFTVWSITEGEDREGNTTYKMKSLQSTTLKLDRTTGKYTADSKLLLLDTAKNVTYYYSVESTNAKKGGNAEYSVSLNDNSAFFTRGDNGDDTWENAQALGTLEETLTVSDGWVGFGDSVDYYSFYMEQGMSISFSIMASDAAKLTVYQLVNGKMKSLQSTTVKAGQGISTKTLKLTERGEYFFCVESTNAKKGGDAGYSVDLNRYYEPLNLTIGGISDKKYEDYMEAIYDGDCNCPEDYWETENYWANHARNCMPKEAVFDTITGGSGNDTITFIADRSRVMGDIYLGAGDDKLIFKAGDTDHDDSETDFRLGNGIVDMGEGNNSIQIGAGSDFAPVDVIFGNGNDEIILEAEAELETWYEGSIQFGNGDNKFIIGKDAWADYFRFVEFGNGNDTIQIAADGELALAGDLIMGEGNDTIQIAADGELECYGRLIMGGGDDKIVIAEGAELKGMLDFGSGTDTLVCNGTIKVYDGYWDEEKGEWGDFDISGLEKLSGNGALVWCGGEEVHLSNSLIEKFKNAGITIVNGLVYGFESVKAEKADDTINGTGVKVLSEEDDDCDIWLCGSEKANSVDFGFTDAVDYVKIVKNNSWDELCIGNNSWEADCDIELLDKSGNRLEDIVLSDWGETCIDDLTNGIYYLKFTVASNSSFSGWIELE